MIIKPDSAEPELIDMCQDCKLWELCKYSFMNINKNIEIVVRQCNEDYQKGKQ